MNTQANEIFEAFKLNTANHEMTVLKDDGTYRHLSFKMKGSRNYQFDLVTWPGHLCYCGDMGDYLFERLEDMFEFFRCKNGDFPKIYPTYWQEKLQAPKPDTVKEYDRDSYEKVAKNSLEQFLDNNDDVDHQAVREQFEDEILESSDEYSGDIAVFEGIRAMSEFNVFPKTPPPRGKVLRPVYPFQDFWEYGESIRKHTYHYLWACFAIQWGIQQYDKKTSKENHD